MRSRDVKWFECPSLLIHLPRDLLFWIPVTDALAFDDYTILHLADHLDCAVDLFSLQHLATSLLSEFLTELRNDRYSGMIAAFSFYTQITPCAWWLPVAIFLHRIFIRDFAQESHSGFSRWILAQLAVLGDIFLQRIARQEFSPQIACVFVWFLSRCDFFARY